MNVEGKNRCNDRSVLLTNIQAASCEDATSKLNLKLGQMEAKLGLKPVTRDIRKSKPGVYKAKLTFQSSGDAAHARQELEQVRGDHSQDGVTGLSRSRRQVGASSRDA